MDRVVSELTCCRGEAIVLEGVSFALRGGRALVLRGPNGAGKTTLLRTLAGLTPPVSGAMPDPEGAAYAGHADGLKAQLTVAENLAFWAAIFGTGPAEVEGAIRGFDLAPLRERRAAELSAGQKRRAGLARLLVTGRDLWLLDEPTVSLDRTAVNRFACVMRGHLDAGGAAILATHIDLGIEADELDVAAFAAKREATLRDPFAEAVE
ncbi:heme ABC exporter ATP-binding protein CcmA [uncultured Jannaschia sp.]|uniref:heme ABC exporter ATP-binding protein CcmA n=1 Tax=uncultured Jannaschia sp. TaxID=293347 RepID=UPI0026052027|nr:heme ABC exporter ATP-binding protein CcmA [uncultured Jannaschia sp.]